MSASGKRRRAWVYLPVGVLLLAWPFAGEAQEPNPPKCAPQIETTSSGERYIPYDVAPRLLNPERVRQAMDSLYRVRHPDRELRVGAAVWVRVDCTGRAEATRWVAPPGDHRRELLDLVRSALELARFEPARNRGEPVTVFIQQAVDLLPTDTSSSRGRDADGWTRSLAPAATVTSGDAELAFLYALEHPEDVRGLALRDYVTIEPAGLDQHREIARVNGTLGDRPPAAEVPDSLLRSADPTV